jgi:HK97 family phage portal protein
LGAITTFLGNTGLIRSPKSSPKKIPTAVAGLAFPEGKQVGKTNAHLFRHWAAHSEWVNAAIKVRRTQVSSAEWDIVPANPDIKRDNKRLAFRIKELLETPNPESDSFRAFIEKVVEDVLTLDAGVIEKIPNLRGEIAELWPVDAAYVKVSSIWDGDPAEPRYFWYPPGTMKPTAFWLNDEMMYMMANPRTYSVVGLSPLETLKSAIDAELSGDEYNRRQVTAAAPDGMLNLGENIRPEQVEQFKGYWLSEVAGKGAMAFLGGTKNPEFIPFRQSNRDMQFLEWQTYLVRKIAAVFQISPQDLGINFDVNQSTSEVMQENTEDRGLRPLLGLLQEYITREVVWHEGFGGPDNNLAFRFTRLNLKETTSKASINKLALAGIPWKTVNEARKEDGREPLGSEYDKLIMSVSTGAVTLEDVPTARESHASRNPTATGENGQQAASSESRRRAPQE